MTTAKAVKSTFDFIVMGAGAAGEAAGHEARRLGASVAVVERELVGGSCPFWACMPSKALLHAAAIHALGGDYPWSRASGFRDWMINRENRDWPDDSSHVTSLAKAGAVVVRGTGRIVGPARPAPQLPANASNRPISAGRGARDGGASPGW